MTPKQKPRHLFNAFTTGRVDLLRCLTVSAGDQDEPALSKKATVSKELQ